MSMLEIKNLHAEAGDAKILKGIDVILFDSGKIAVVADTELPRM